MDEVSIINISNVESIFSLLKLVTEKLDSIKIPYMLSGSMAMNVYTVPRMTRDIDIVVALFQQHIPLLTESFGEGFYFYPEEVKEEIGREGMFNIIHHDSGQKVDFIIRKSSPFHIGEFKRRVNNYDYGFNLYIATPEDLIISKLIWVQQLTSDTQLRDIQNLLRLSTIDKSYIEKWVVQLKLKTFGLW
jgi:hypothetical protein